MFRSFEANSGTIQGKGSEDLAKSSASAVDSSNLGQAPRLPRMAYGKNGLSMSNIQIEVVGGRIVFGSASELFRGRGRSNVPIDNGIKSFKIFYAYIG